MGLVADGGAFRGKWNAPFARSIAFPTSRAESAREMGTRISHAAEAGHPPLLLHVRAEILPDELAGEGG